MKKSLRNLFGLRRKSEPTTKAQALVIPNFWDSNVAFDAAKEHMAEIARQNPDQFRAMLRRGTFESPRTWLGINFPAAQVMETEPYKPLRDVPEDDVRCFFAVDARLPNPRAIVAAMMVVMPPESLDGPRLPVAGEGMEHPVMKIAEAALLDQLQYMHGQGVVDTLVAVITIGIDMVVYRFSPEKGLEDVPEELDVVVKRMEAPRR